MEHKDQLSIGETEPLNSLTFPVKVKSPDEQQTTTPTRSTQIICSKTKTALQSQIKGVETQNNHPEESKELTTFYRDGRKTVNSSQRSQRSRRPRLTLSRSPATNTDTYTDIQ